MADSTPVLSAELTRVNDRIGKISPFGQFEFHTITFSATPGVDTAIAHGLRPSPADSVGYFVIQQSAAGSVYQDSSITRRPWTASTIYLRSDVASLRVVLVIFTPSVSFTSLVASL